MKKQNPTGDRYAWNWSPNPVIPAQAGIHVAQTRVRNSILRKEKKWYNSFGFVINLLQWIPACAGMTGLMLSIPIHAKPLSNLEADCPVLTYEAQPENWPGQFRDRMLTMGDNVPAEFLDQVQQPLTPEKSIGCQKTPVGFQSLLWASEELLGGTFKTWDITWDNRGRAWVAETYDYPNEKFAHGEGNDRISILEDTDNDGVVDKTTPFVENLNMPFTLLHVKEGLLVYVRDRILLFTDEDGDDQADDPLGRVLYRGFGTGDTHGTVTHFTLGLDNWVYCSVGYNGAQATGYPLSGGGNQSVEVDRFGGGWAFRFKSDGTALEGLGSPGCNMAALGMMEDGNKFFSNATCGKHTVHMIYPGKQTSISDHGQRLTAETMDVNVWEGSNSFTATAGHNFYTARYFPERYWSKAAFINEGPYHLVHTDFYTRDKHTFTASNNPDESNLLASSDSWTAPVFSITGPDGAVWVIDWYNYIFLHNPAQPMGEGRAHITSIRDNTMSRIYRITRTDTTPLDKIVNLGPGTPLEVVASYLAHSNLFWRQTAQVELLKRGFSPELVTLLRSFLNDRHVDNIGFSALPVHALWTLHGLGEFQNNFDAYQDLLVNTLAHPSPAVRTAVLGVLPGTAASAGIIRDTHMLNDKDPGVRMAAALAIRDMPQTENVVMSAAYCNFDSFMADFRSGTYDNNFSALPSSNAIGVSSRIQCTNTTFEPVLDDGIPQTGDHPYLIVNNHPRAPVSKSYHLYLGKSGMLELASWTSLDPGTVMIYTAKGSLVGSQKFDGEAFSGNPLRAGTGIRFYRYKSEKGLQLKGILAGL